MKLIEPLEDIGDQKRGSPRGAVLPGNIGLLGEARSHVVHDGYDDADRVLGDWDTLGELQKEKHFGLEHHSDGPRRGDGWGTGRDGETELDIPLELSSLVGEQFKLHDAHTVSKNISGSSQEFSEGTQSVEFKGRPSNPSLKEPLQHLELLLGPRTCVLWGNFELQSLVVLWIESHSALKNIRFEHDHAWLVGVHDR